MDRAVKFSSDALDQFSDWAIVDRNIFKKLVDLILEIRRNPFEGKGKPEPLKHELKGFWSRRITIEHRIVYRVAIQANEEIVEIISCKGHYE